MTSFRFHWRSTSHAEHPKRELNPTRLTQDFSPLLVAEQSAHYSCSLAESHGPDPIRRVALSLHQIQHTLDPVTANPIKSTSIGKLISCLVLREPGFKGAAVAKGWEDTWSRRSFEGGIKVDQAKIRSEKVFELDTLALIDLGIRTTAMETSDQWHFGLRGHLLLSQE